MRQLISIAHFFDPRAQRLLNGVLNGVLFGDGIRLILCRMNQFTSIHLRISVHPTS